MSSSYTRWYRVGSVNVTQGSRVVTGVDTYWLDAGLNPGDIFATDLQTDYEIAEVTDSTHITLATPYEGATATGKAYRIIRNFTATLPADIAAKTAELLGDFRRYVDTDMQSIQGKSAYEIAVAHGYVGTESDWLESLKAAAEVQRIDGDIAALDAKHTARSALINNGNAPIHRTIFGGRSLGNALTSEQSTAIRNGTFDGIYVGDYWDIPVPAYSWTDGDGTVHNESAYTQRFRVADMDYYYQMGNPATTAHHLVVLTDRPTRTCSMNDTQTAESGYVGSKMYTSHLNKERAIYEAAFGSGHLLSHSVMLENSATVNSETGALSIGKAWYSRKVELMAIGMVLGYLGQGMFQDTELQPLAIFRLWESYRSPRMSNIWLRNVHSSVGFRVIGMFGHYGGGPANAGWYNVWAYGLVY